MNFFLCIRIESHGINSSHGNHRIIYIFYYLKGKKPFIFLQQPFRLNKWNSQHFCGECGFWFINYIAAFLCALHFVFFHAMSVAGGHKVQLHFKHKSTKLGFFYSVALIINIGTVEIIFFPFIECRVFPSVIQTKWSIYQVMNKIIEIIKKLVN